MRSLLKWNTIDIVRLLLLAVLYYLGAILGKLIAIPPGNITALWPPSGVAFAAVLLLGYRYWPGIWLGSFAFNILFFRAMGQSMHADYVLACVVVATGASVEACLGAYLARKYVGYSNTALTFGRFLGTLMVGGPLCTTLNATVGTTSFNLIGAVAPVQYVNTWLTWWFGDTAGVLVFSGVIILIVHLLREEEFNRERFRQDRIWYVSSFLMLAFVPGLTLTGYVWLLASPMPESRLQATLVLILGLIVTLTLTALLIGLNTSRSRALRLAEEAERMLRDKTRAMESAIGGISELDESGTCLSANQSFADMFDYYLSEIPGMHWESLILGEDRAVLDDILRACGNREKVEVDIRGLRKDGSVFRFRSAVIRKRHQAGYYFFAQEAGGR